MAKASISVAKGKGSIHHNNRDFVTENVDIEHTKDNITYKAEPLEQAYEKCFGRAIEDYNLNQKRADRKIDGASGYMEQIRTSKNGEKLFYENVVQVGNMFDSHVGTEQGEVCKKVLNDYMKGFQDRNPNLYVFNAVLHLDEQTPHLHIDYIPIATDYQKGLQVRNSLDKAFKQQGLEGKSNKYENRTIAWQNAEKDHIEQIMKSRGLERAEDKGIDQDHLTVDQYKASMEHIKNEVNEIPSQIESTPTLLNKDKVIVKKEDLELLEQRARLSTVHEKTAKEIVKSISDTKKNGAEYVATKMSLSLSELGRAEKEYDKAAAERKAAEEMKQKYTSLYKQQEKLNDSYNQLYKIYETEKNLGETQKQINELLVKENTSLKAQIVDLKQSIDEKVQQAVEPLKKQIESLKEDLRGTIKSLTSVVKAVGMFKYDKEEYKAPLTEKQEKLVDAIADYSKAWIENNGKALGDDTVEVCKADIDSNVGISKGIQEFMQPQYPDKLIFRGGEQGRGFYDEDKNFYGGKEILKELKENKVKISDPYELLPNGRSH